MEGVNPLLIECADRTIVESIYDLTIPWRGGVRTAEQQKELFDQGNSKCDGYEVLSYHQIEASEGPYGNAIDIIPYLPGGAPYEDIRKLNYIGRMMMINWQELIQESVEDIGVMIWGGTFGATSWDRPHFEIRQ